MLYSAVAALFLAAGVSYWYKKKNLIPTPEGRGGWLFHADAVIELDWLAHGEKTANYKRSDRNHPWRPPVNPMRIQDRLNTLGELHLETMDAPSKASVQIILTFSDQQVWDGSFDGENFVWTSGTHEGQGARLSETQLSIFQEGRYAFQDHNHNWCPRRIKSIKIGDRYHLHQEGLRWVVEQDGKTRDTNPTFVEKWFGKYCLAEAETLVDYDVTDKPSGGDELVIEYETQSLAAPKKNGKKEENGSAKEEFNLIDGYKFYGEKFGIISREFGTALAELQAQ